MVNPEHCPMCLSDDPRLRGGPSIGYGCYDPFHDPPASAADRELAAKLRAEDPRYQTRAWWFRVWLKILRTFGLGDQ